MAETLDQLAESLALGEGFQLGLLVVPDLASADLATGALQRLLSARKGHPAHLSRICPSPELTDGEALAAQALDPLVELPSSDGVILDASAATARTEPAWAEVFRRLNGRRNGFARQLARALVLCLTPRLEVVLSREAPDLWSIRGPRAELVRRERRSAEASGEVRFEAVLAAGLVDGLKRIFPHPRAALPLLAELGYPPAKLPLSDAADFWPLVLRALDSGRLPGGIDTLIRRLAREYGDEPGVARCMALLPQRVAVQQDWVVPSLYEPIPNSLALSPRQKAAMLEVLDFLRGPPGRRLGIVGDQGVGRNIVWKSALDAARPEGIHPILVEQDAQDLMRSLWHAVATTLEPLEPPLRALAVALQRGRRPDALARAALPPHIQQLIPTNPLQPTHEDLPEHSSDLLFQVLGDRARFVHEVNFSSLYAPQECLQELDALAPPDPSSPGARFWAAVSQVVILPSHLREVARPHMDVLVEVGPTQAEDHLQILAHRLKKASPLTRLVFDSPDMRKVVDALAAIATTPAAFLGWVDGLVRRGPLPPPPDWTSREALAQLVWETDPIEPLLDLGAHLDGQSCDPSDLPLSQGLDLEDLLEPFWDKSSSFEAPERPALLERDPTNPDLLRLTPEAALLRPSVAERLARDVTAS